MPLTSDIGGVVPIAPTPFHPDGRIDEVSLDRMTDFFGAAGVDGLTILGLHTASPEDLRRSTALQDLLDKAGVAGVPGSGFGAHGHIRFSFAVSMQTLEQALERIGISLPQSRAGA